MNKVFGLILLLVAIIACDRQQKPAVSTDLVASTGKGGHFAFSSHTFSLSAPPADNWCRIVFAEAAVLSADPVNVNRRLFTLSEGPHKVTVDFGNIVAAFILQKKGNSVEIFTSDNYPECLSKRSNFSINADGMSFRYDNQKHIQFEIQLLPQPNGTQIALEMSPGAGYGIIVRR